MVEMADIPVESLVPEPLRALKGGDEYMKRLPEFDAEMEKQLKSAEATGEVRAVGITQCPSSMRWGEIASSSWGGRLGEALSDTGGLRNAARGISPDVFPLTTLAPLSFP